MAIENTAHRESPERRTQSTTLAGQISLTASQEKDPHMQTQLTETQSTTGQNGFEFANDQITGAAGQTGVLPRAPAQLPETTAGAKYPWPENGFVFSNDGSLLSIHNGVCPIAVMYPGFQWRWPVCRPGSRLKERRKKRPVSPHYN